MAQAPVCGRVRAWGTRRWSSSQPVQVDVDLIGSYSLDDPLEHQEPTIAGKVVVPTSTREYEIALEELRGSPERETAAPHPWPLP